MVEDNAIANSVPDLGSLESGEICTGILIIVALISAISSISTAISDYASYSTTISIIFGLAAIAVAILAAGRRIAGNSDDLKEENKPELN